MKLIGTKLVVAIGLLISSCAPAMANESDKLVTDTKEVLGKSLEGFLTYDFIDSDRIPGSRAGIGTKVVAWRFLAVQPSVSYGPNVHDREFNFEVMFPFRLSRIPLGDGTELGDLFPGNSKGTKWFLTLVDGFYATINVTSGGSNVGWRLSFGD